MKSQFLTAKQLSAMLGIPEGTIRYWRNAGLGPAWHKLEGSIRYALKDVEVTSNAVVEFLPCGHTWRIDMALYKRGGLWHYDFAVNGKRFQGSTKEKTQSKARSIESALMQEAMDRRLPGRRRAVLLADFSVRFLEWVSASRLELKSKMYYERGWKLLAQTAIAQMQLSHITTDEAEVLHFGSSPANGNCALRTLRRMLGKAMEWDLTSAAPRIKLLKRRDALPFSMRKPSRSYLRRQNSRCGMWL